MIIYTHKLDEKIKTVNNNVILNSNQRLKNRIKLILNNGEVAFIILKQRIFIRGGDVLSDDQEKEIIRIIAAKEKISSIYCNNTLKLLKICYHLGNRHVSLEIKKNKISYITDYVLDNLVKKIGLKVYHELSPFEPEGGAYEKNENI